jgi:uncharacterized protein involved in tolerance to divalent cations
MPDDSKPNKFIELILSCSSWQQAQRLADSLLAKQLVTHVELIEVKSEGAEAVQHIKLIVRSLKDQLSDIENEVAIELGGQPALEVIPSSGLIEAAYPVSE